MKKSILLLSFGLTALSLTFVACDKKEESTPPPAAEPTLYERVGGTALVADPSDPTKMIETGRLTLRSVVDSSIFVVAADPALQKYFEVLFAELGAGTTTGLTALSENLTDFFCAATGSKNTAYAYVGKSMLAAHDPATNNRMALKSNEADFNAFVNDVGAGLAENGVDGKNADGSANATETKLITDLVALLNTLKSDIVQRTN